MVKESSPNVLKAIVSAVKKSSNTISVEHLEFLTYHDWKKCKYLLTDFIQSSKLSLPALEFVKNMGLVTSQSQGNSKRSVSDKEPGNSNFNMSSLLNNPAINPLKQFYSSIQNLIPRMSSPDVSVRMVAAESALQSLSTVAAGAPI